MDKLKITIPGKPEYLTMVRLAIGSIATTAGFSLDDIEDIKVAVSEACTNAIKHSLDNKFGVTFEVLENGLAIEIQDNGKGCDVDCLGKPDLENPKENGLGIFIIQTLMDEVSIESENNKGTKIRMTKYLGVDN